MLYQTSYQSLFNFRNVKKTIKLWKQAFSGELTVDLPIIRPFNIKENDLYYPEGFNPFENHILYKLDRRLYLIYQATKYQFSNILCIFDEVYFASALLETIFFRIRHNGDQYGYNGFKGFIRFWKDVKFEFGCYIRRRIWMIWKIACKV